MKVLSLLMRYSRGIFVLTILAGIVSGACNTGLLAIINHLLISGRPRTEAVIIGYAAFCLLFLGSKFISELLLMHIGQRAYFELRMKMSRQILGAPLSHLEELGPGRLLASLTDDIPAITNAFLVLPNLFISLFIAVGCLAYMAWLSLPALLAIVVLVGLGMTSYQLQVKRAEKYIRTARNYADTLLKHFRAITDGTKELKLHRERREAFLNDDLRSTALAVKQYNTQGMTVYAMANSWGQTLTFFALGLLMFVFPLFNSIGTTTLASFTVALFFLTAYIPVILSVLPAITRANVSLNKVEQLGLSLEKNTSECESSLTERAPATWESFELNGVTHTYYQERENSKFVLGPIDLSFRPGELVFIIGGNGSGKTTLAKLLTGLYVPETGIIRLNGKPVTNRTREQYRQYFSVIFSDFYLFENLLGLNSPELDEQARRYLTQLQLDHKVKVQNGQLSTIDLSRGQRKRLALLTAFLEDRPIYIFDEWAADQDPSFKEFFYLTLLPELKERGKTVLAISHDDRYYNLADRIIKLDYGKIELDQRVEELLLMNGLEEATASEVLQ
jgi:putative ATP-binding cassette transporter